MRDHDDALLVGTEVELAEGSPASRGRVIEARTDREYVVIAGGAVLTLQRHELTPVPCSHCGADLHQLRLLMERGRKERNGLQNDLVTFQTREGRLRADAAALRDEIHALEAKLSAAQAAAVGKAAEQEQEMKAIVSAKIEEALAAVYEGEQDPAQCDEDRAQTAEQALQAPLATVAACGEGGQACSLSARSAYDHLCEALTHLHLYSSNFRPPTPGDDRTDSEFPSFLSMVQSRRLRAMATSIGNALVQTESCFGWGGHICQLAGKDRQPDLPPPPLDLPELATAAATNPAPPKYPGLEEGAGLQPLEPVAHTPSLASLGSAGRAGADRAANSEDREVRLPELSAHGEDASIAPTEPADFPLSSNASADY
ncbi:hypothetical protein DIPPA_12808 [Diplonema papillatum]|nr:hypothetical protein DIPPA_12808 [Diplonema papillatum]